MVGVEELRIPVPWGIVAAKAWGSPTKYKVLAIHGFLDNAGFFDKLIPQLEDLFYVVCVDLPGHGLSSHFLPGVCFSQLDIAFALNRVIDHLHWNQFSIVAHSFGGHFAIYFAALYGDSINRLIIVDLFFANLIPNDEFIIERCIRVFNKILKIENEPKETFTYEKSLQKLSDDRLFEISIKNAKTLQKRAYTKTANGYINNTDRRLQILKHPLITVSFHNALIKNFNSNLLVISTSEFEPFLHSFPVTKNSLNELKLHLKHKMQIVKVQGSHDVLMDNPEIIAPIIKEYICHQQSHL